MQKIEQLSWPGLMIFLWLYSYLYTPFVSCQFLENQESFLIELKNNLVFDTEGYSDMLVGWNQTTDYCQWSGVKCENSSGRVIGLDLSRKEIIGGINNSCSLFYLKFLKRLNLANNNMNGEIPPAIGRLSSLVYLNFSNAGFSGQVPYEISLLSDLIVLDLSNQMSLVNPLVMHKPNLATIIRNLTNIRELYLDGVDVSSMGNKWCKALSSSLAHLQVLHMSSCELQGKIQDSLSQLQHLSVIHLDYNPLFGPIPEFLAEFSNLTTLSLCFCNLTGIVPQKIFQVPSLTILDLSYNYELQGTLPVFKNNGTEKEKFRLHSIRLAQCKFHGSIPTSMGSLNLLEEVDFSGNQFSGDIPSFSLAKNLTSLLFGNNELTGVITTTDWGKLLNLVHIDFSQNALDGNIPVSLFSLPSVQSIELQDNKFSGQLNEFAKTVSFKLDTLDLSNNSLEGPIPKSIVKLRGLVSLDLSSNRFNGTLKLAEILLGFKNLNELCLSFNNLSIETDGYGLNSSFPQLEILRLASCNLHTIPEFLKNQTSLYTLDLSMNHISGTVPSWIWEIDDGFNFNLNFSFNYLVNLEPPLMLSNNSPWTTLDLQSNNFQGQFPVVSSKLFFLDCSNNNFTSIDPNIGNHMSWFNFFSFSRNNLFGDIPLALCNTTILELLNLEHNNLHGTIPDCLVNITSLKVLNLAENKLVGTIPDKFGTQNKFQILQLNENFLQGRVPRSLANCKDLKLLDLGVNKLYDTFPCHLQSLSNLQVLFLRSNKFHGTIACPKSHSIWPLLQMVDLSSNHFTGKLTAQILCEWTSMMVGASIDQSKISYLKSEVLGWYYQNSEEATFKGSTHKLQYILTRFSIIDFSNNAFHGELPQELGNLNALIVLNLSHNSFSGKIPSSIGNLSQIESLDLSCNSFSGHIPPQLANLNFLGYLNLSSNKLSGQIPESTQLQSFNASSYEGNKGLYGPPLIPISRSEPDRGTTPSTSSHGEHWRPNSQVECMLSGAVVGFLVGLMFFIGPLVCIKKWRKWYSKRLDKLVMKILCK